MQSTTIPLRGVRVHNLKSIDVDIPLGGLTVVTGVSGAGKSSLVFDTLFAEAQRRYVQSFSVYTRQFLERFDRPHADTIGDLPPAIAIRRAQVGATETVGALTGLAEAVRLLFTRAGTLHCPACGLPVRAQRTDDVLAALQALPVGTRVALAFSSLAPDVSEQPAWRASLREEGYVRIQHAGQIHRLDEPAAPTIPPGSAVWVLVDRVEAGKTPAERVRESVEAAFRRGEGRMGLLTDTSETVFDQRPVCARCGQPLAELSPRLFDARDPIGACETCQGTGVLGKSGVPCNACAGLGLNAVARAVRLGDTVIADWLTRPCDEVANVLHRLDLPAEHRALTDSMRDRLGTLTSLDLAFLTLAQPASRLSDGALRRIALAAALASSLVQVLYLIDEPTLGMHPRDVPRLVAALHRLCDRGNTVVVIEHERTLIASADHVIDLGPGAGDEGGTLVYQGAPAGLADAPESPTSDFWTGRDAIDVPDARRKPIGMLTLKAPSYEFPLGVLCAVTGVAGAGARRLVMDTLARALDAAKKKKDVPSPVAGAGKLADVVLLDQAPLPRSARSNPATLLKIFDEIRALYAATTDAKIRNFGPGHFSFNQPGGRCETCEGEGTLTIDMQFLADVTTTCPECQGKRYRKEVLDIKVRNRSIAEVLDLTVREAFRFFRAQPKIEKKLKVLIDVGLEYLRLGQPVDTLAIGEGQRLKLASHLASSRKAGCLFLLEEPSAGLHPADVANLLACFDRLLDTGHSLIVVDNDIDVLACADWIIELDAGQVVAQGTPEAVAQYPSATATSLRGRLT